MDELTQRIAIHEGFDSKMYRDTLGNWTIGYGTCLSDGITQHQAQLLLEDGIELAKNDLAGKSFYEDLDPVRQGVLIEFVYNIGIDSLLSFKNMLQAISLKDWTTAVAQARDSKWANEVGSIRVNDMCSRLLTGEYAS